MIPIGFVEEAIPIRREAEAANAANPEIIRVVIADDHTLVREGIHQLLSADTGARWAAFAGVSDTLGSCLSSSRSPISSPSRAGPGS